MRRLAFLSVFLLPVLSSATLIKRCQHPAPSPDGKWVVFSWQGDLWKVAAAGGRAERLTVHSANDYYPRFTPDGSRIVFASNRFGSVDVFSMKADGTDLKRLTFDSGSEIPTGISPDGTTVYGHTNAFGDMDLFRVPITGGDLVRITNHPLEKEYNASVSADGSRVYYNRGSYGPASWKKPGVMSSGLGDVWVADNTVPLTNHKVVMKSEANELMPQVGGSGELVYQSNASGWPNLYLGKKKLTNHTDGTVRFPQINTGKTMVAYEFNSEIWVYDLAKGTDTKLVIEVPDDERNNPIADTTLAEGIGDYSVSPDGKRIVISVRGELFLIPEKGGTTRRLTNNPGLDYQCIWLNPKTILYVSAGENAKRELRTVDIDGNSKPYLTATEDLMHPALSPDGKWVAYHSGGTDIKVVPATGGEAKLVYSGNFADMFDGTESFSWSPDSKWLAVSSSTDRGADVLVVPVDGGAAITVAKLSQNASVPKFLPNGRGIYFTGQWEEENELFLVDLVQDEPTFSEDDLDKIDAPKPAPAGEVKVEVQTAGILRRMRKLSTGGAFAPFASADSKTIFFSGGTPLGLQSVRVAGGAAVPVTGAGALSNPSLGAGGQKYYGLIAGKLYSMAPGGTPSPIGFSARWDIDLRAEEKALFADIWWAMDRMYYDPQLNGKGWPHLREKFAQVVPYCWSRTDFYALMGDMMEELDSSHLGSTAPRATDATLGTDSTALLGIEVDPAALQSKNVYIVNRVITGSAADNPASKLMLGDKIIAIDGVAPSPQNPMAALLNKKAGKKVKLNIERDGKALEVLIKPDSKAILSSLQYEEYVEQQRALVDKLSGGKLTYFHVEGMNEPSFQRFLREIRTFAPGKKGAIVDVRYNGGGSTSHKILGVLIKTPWLIRTTRGPKGIKLSENIYRGDSLEIPTALMINDESFSNAEVMAEGFRKLIKGPIVGVKTPGYVIGTGGYLLWDGGLIRMPSIGAYAVDGENLENNGRKPDFPVPFDPDAWAAGRDLQTEKTVAELLKRLGG